MFGLWWHRGGRSTEGVGYTEVAMTKSMQELLDRMAELPEDEQERIAERFLKELADNARWERILAETQGELRKLGLEGMNLLEQPFDPNLAEAVMHEPGDGAETVVSEVLRSGYTWQGRVLRAAMVKVRG